jgi:hypothetical protein
MNNHKRSYSRLVSVLVLTLTLMCTATAQSMAPSGSFGFLLNYSFIPQFANMGLAVLGMMNFDGAGNMTGTYTVVVGASGSQPAQTITGTFTGTYSVNPDGTSSASITTDLGVTLTFAMLITDRGQGLQLVVTSCTGGGCDLSGTLISGFGRAANAGPPNGSYGFQFNGSPAPAANIGVLNFDGAGTVAISFKNVGVANGPGGTPINQAPVTSGATTGTYSVNPDGSGTVTFPGAASAFVMIDGGSGLLWLRTTGTGSNVMLGTARLQ